MTTPSIRPISDLRNSANEISDFCRQSREPVYITRSGTGDMVVMNIEEYERQMALIDLYGKLAVAEAEISSGAAGPFGCDRLPQYSFQRSGLEFL